MSMEELFEGEFEKELLKHWKKYQALREQGFFLPATIAEKILPEMPEECRVACILIGLEAISIEVLRRRRT